MIVPPAPPDAPAVYRLAGERTCASCHADDCAIWADGPHARAWTVLTKQGAHVDPACQVCHTTGYGLPGGFASVATSSEVVAVRCESCHGPALAHTRRPQTRTPFAARDQCVRCHDRENSPKFDYAVYWPRIQHGAPAERPPEP